MRVAQLSLALALAAAMLAMPSSLLADEADDQFAVAAGHYAAKRWDLAADEFQRFLNNYADHVKRNKALFFSGEALVQAGKLPEAASQFAALLEADPHGRYARQALFRAGECAFLTGNSSDAKSSLTKFRKQYPDDPLMAYALSYLGELSLRDGDAAMAKSCFAEVVERFGEKPVADESRLGLAKSFLRLNEYRGAENALNALLKTKQRNVETHYWLGQVYKALEQWERAASEFRAGIEANPPATVLPTLRYEAAESLLRGQQYQAVIDLLGRGETQDAAAQPPAQRYLVALAQQGLGRHEDTLTTLDSLAVSASTELAQDVLLARAASLVALDRQRDAIQSLNKYLATSDNDPARRPTVLAQVVLAHAHEKEFNEAKAALHQLIEAAPHSELLVATVLQLSKMARSAEENQLAIEWLESLDLDQTPGSLAADVLIDLAEIWADKGKLEKSAGCYERLLDRYPDEPAAVPAALACARVRERMGQNDAALAMYNLVIEKHDEAEQLPQALLRAANLYDRLSQEAKAIELYERLVRRFGSSTLAPAAVYGWAWCLRDLKRDGEANEKFEEIRRGYPASEYWADATYRLALAAAQSKQTERALSLLAELIDTVNKNRLEFDRSQPVKAGGEVNVSDDGDGPPTAGVAANVITAKVSAETLEFALYLRAQISIGREKWDDAVRDLEQLVRDHPSCRLALVAEFLLADVCYRRAEFQQASERFAALSPKTKDRHDPWIAMIPLRQAQLLAQDKRWSDARAIASRIAKDFPGFAQQYEVDYLIGRTFAAEADFQQARAAYQQVLQSKKGANSETAAMAQWMIGETYFLQEQFDTAVREYLRVEVLYAYPRWQSAALLQAGKCYEQLGKWKDAGDAYTRLLKLHGQSEFAAEAQQRLQNVQSRTAARSSN